MKPIRTACECGSSGRFLQDDDGEIVRHCACGGTKAQEWICTRSDEELSAVEFFEAKLKVEPKSGKLSEFGIDFVSRCIGQGWVEPPDRFGRPRNPWAQTERPKSLPESGEWIITYLSSGERKRALLTGVPSGVVCADMLRAEAFRLVREFLDPTASEVTVAWSTTSSLLAA